MKFSMKPFATGTRGRMAELPIHVTTTPEEKPTMTTTPYRPQVSLQSVSIVDAQYAVVGVSHDGHRGILSWHSYEFVAKRAAIEMRKAGGKATVFPAPQGDTKTFDPVVKAIVNGLPWH
jgi:hypothetical protein